MGKLNCSKCCNGHDEIKMNKTQLYTNQDYETTIIVDYSAPDLNTVITKLQAKFRGYMLRKILEKVLKPKNKLHHFKNGLREVTIDDFHNNNWDKFFAKITLNITDVPEMIVNFYENLFENYENNTKIISLRVDDFELTSEELFENKFKMVIIKMVSFYFNIGPNDSSIADLKVFNEEYKYKVNINANSKSRKSNDKNNEYLELDSNLNKGGNFNINVLEEKYSEKKTTYPLSEEEIKSKNSSSSNRTIKKVGFQNVECVHEQLDYFVFDREALPSIFHTDRNEQDKKEDEMRKSNFFEMFNLNKVNQAAKLTNKKYIFTFKYICEEIFRNDKEEITMEKYIFNKTDSTYYKGTFHILLEEKYGFGTQYMINKNVGFLYKYKGFFVNNLFHGYGLIQKEGGYLYYGEFRNGIQTGFGVELTDVGTYIGLFLNGKFQGYGEYKSKSKKYYYKGGYRDGQKEGLGHLVYDDGSQYLGNFKQNKMAGIGFYYWYVGHKYYGSWKDDKMHGRGKYVWQTGDTYIGPYENDKKHGDGVYTYIHNGAELRGTWKNGRKEGNFVLKEGVNKFSVKFKKDQQVEE